MKNETILLTECSMTNKTKVQEKRQKLNEF